jgi:crotonobetainyl-CoA:carnitine CoA-transferase CaiB-like acyl-CoA transferase
VVSDTQWRVFCEAFALQDLLADPALATNAARVRARDRFMPRLKALFAQMPRAAILEACERLRLPFAPIMRPHDMFADPHLNHPGAMVDVTLPDGRTSPMPALPLELNGARLGVYRDIPKAGEHSAMIAHELGLTPAQIDALVEAGVIGL